MNRILRFILDYENQDILAFQKDILSGLGYETEKAFFESEEIRAFSNYVYSSEYRETLKTLTPTQRSYIGMITLALKHSEPLGIEIVDYPNTIPDRD